MNIQHAAGVSLWNLQEAQPPGETNEVRADAFDFAENGVGKLLNVGESFPVDDNCRNIGLRSALQSDKAHPRTDDQFDPRVQSTRRDLIEQILECCPRAANQNDK